MKHFIKRFIVRKIDLVVGEGDVLKVLRVVNDHRIFGNIKVVGYPWSGYKKWHVRFIVRQRQWELIRHDLLNGDFNNVLFYGKSYRRLRFGD